LQPHSLYVKHFATLWGLLSFRNEPVEVSISTWWIRHAQPDNTMLYLKLTPQLVDVQKLKTNIHNIL